jgi:NADH-quinone oxidoreductase subunit I
MRCIYCGFCADACPTEAIVLEHIYELAYTDRSEAFFTKEEFLDPVSDIGLKTPQKVEPGVFIRSIPQMKDPV